MDQAEYTAYLQTEHWRLMRAAAIERAERRCQLCYSPGPLEVHHRTYDRVGWEHATDLTVLCARCHGLFHGVITAVRERAFAPRVEQGRYLRLARGESTPDYVAIARGEVKAE